MYLPAVCSSDALFPHDTPRNSVLDLRRRKFYDIQIAHKSPVAAEALERIGALYAVESDINGRSPEERREIRNTRSRPLLGSLKQWLEETLVKLSKKSDTAIAVRYALGRWGALLRYCDDGHLEIDNNAAHFYYTQVSFEALRTVARSWPVIGGAQ